MSTSAGDLLVRARRPIRRVGSHELEGVVAEWGLVAALGHTRPADLVDGYRAWRSPFKPATSSAHRLAMTSSLFGDSSFSKL
jgi:hypothetical protein